MKYRIQVTVDGDRLAAIIQVAFDGVTFDPDLKVYPASEPSRGLALHSMAHPIAPPQDKPTNRRGDIVEAALKTGPKRWGELRTALAEGGLSESSLNSLIGKWQKAKKITRDADGLWRLVAEQEHAHVKAHA
jgi:hypothetical protein